MGNLEDSGFEGKAHENIGFPIIIQLNMKRHHIDRIKFSL